MAATLKPLMVIVAGAASKAGSVAGSVAFATNDMRNDVRSRIEGAGTTVTAASGDVNVVSRLLNNDQTPNIALSEDGNGDSSDDPIIDAQIWSFAIAGAGSEGQAGAGAVTLNWLRNSLDAHVSDQAVVTATSGHIDITAYDNGTLNSLGGGAAGAQSGAVGAAVGYNYLGGNPDNPSDTSSYVIKAYVDNATVRANTIDVHAFSDGDINTLALALAGGGTFNGAGSLSLNFIRKEVDAHVSNVGLAQEMRATGDINIVAEDISKVRSAAGQIAGGKGVSIGGSVAYNEIDNNIKSYIESSNVEVTTGNSGNVTVNADSKSTILTLAAGIAGGSVGVAGSGIGSKIDGTVEAYIDRSTVTTDDNIYVHAESDERMDPFAGSIGVGKVGVGASASVILFKQATAAYVIGSTLDAGVDVDVHADSKQDALIRVTNLAGGKGALAGSVSVLEIEPIVKAFVGDYVPDSGASTQSVITTGRDLLVVADQTTNVNRSDSGNPEGWVGAASGGLVGAGGSVEVIKIRPGVEARIGDNTDVDSGRHIKVVGSAQHDVDLITVAFAGGGIGVSGAVTVLRIGGTINDDSGAFNIGDVESLVNGSLSDTFSIQINDVSQLGIIEASVGSNATLDAGLSNSNGDILVQATEDIDMRAWAGAAAIGAVGVGGAVSVTFVKSEQVAFIDNGATLAAADDITVEATLNNVSDVNAYGGAAGAVGLGAQVVIYRDDATQLAFMDDGTSSSNAVKVTSADDVKVRAYANRDIDVHAQGASAGAIAAGAAAGEIRVGGSTLAYLGEYTQVGQSSGTVNDVIVEADSDVKGKWLVVASAGGIGAGIGNDANGRFTPDIYAFIDQNASVDVDDAVTVTASFTPDLDLTLKGAAGGYLTVGVSKADDVLIEPDVVASLGDPTNSANGNVTIDATTLTVFAESALPSSGYSAKVFNRASSGSLIGVNAVLSDVENKTDVTSFIGKDSTLTVSGVVTVEAENQSKHDVASKTVTGGWIAGGASKSTATTNKNTNAFVAGEGTINADQLLIKAYAEDNTVIDGRAGGGGVASGAGVELETTHTSNVVAEVRDGISADKSVINLTGGATGSFTIEADNVTNFNHTGRIGNGGVLSGTGANIDHTVTANVTAEVGDYVDLDAKSIQMDAVNKIVKPSGTHFRGDQGGVIDGTNVDSDIDIDLTTKTIIGDNSTLDVTGDKLAPGAFSLNALNDLEVYEKINLISGGLVAGAGAFVDIDLTTNIAAVEIGDSDLTTIGDIDISARGKGTVSGVGNAETKGAVTVQNSDSKVEVTPANSVVFKSGATVKADGDVNATTGTGTDFARDSYTIESRLDMYAGSLIPITSIDAVAKLKQTNTIDVQSTALIESGGIVRLYAEQDGFADMTGKAKATSIYGDNDFSDGKTNESGAEEYKGTIESGAAASVIIDGKVETGVNRTQSVLFDNWTGTTVGDDGSTTDGITYRSAVELVSSGLVADLEFVESQLAQFGDSNDTLEAYYDSEKVRIIGELRDQGLWDDSIDSVIQQSGLKVVVNPIRAEAGFISVFADQLYGSGSIVAPGDASISVINQTPAFLDIQGAVIPDTNGGLQLNGVPVSAASDIETLNAADDGATLGTVSFTTIDNSGASTEPTITIHQQAYADDGNAYPAPTVTINGDIINSGGAVTLTNDLGSILANAAVTSETLTITAAGSFVIDGASSFSVNGEAYETWETATAKGVQRASAASVNTIFTSTPTDYALYADSISIDAEYINVKDIIQSGKSRYDLTIGSATQTEIDGLSKATSRKLLRTISNSDFTAYYNPKEDRIELEPLRVSGGKIELIGHILNTQNGEIKALGGYSQINVTNDTDYDLAIMGLDAANRGSGTILLADKAKFKVSPPTADYVSSAGSTAVSEGTLVKLTSGYDVTKGQPGGFYKYIAETPATVNLSNANYKDASTWVLVDAYVSLYEQDSSGTTLTTDDGKTTSAPTSVSASSQYSPAANWRYGWSVESVTLDITETKYETDKLFGADWLQVRNDSNITNQETRQLSGPAISDEGPYYYIDDTDNSRYRFGTPNVVNDSTKAYEIRHWTSKSWLRLVTAYHAPWAEEVGSTATYSHSVEADRAIDIKFIGSGTSRITVNSTDADADVYLLGPVANGVGTTTINSAGDIIQAVPEAFVSGKRIVLTAAGDIVDQTPGDGLNINQADLANASFKATSTAGNIEIEELADDLRLDEIVASSGNVLVDSSGDILIANSKTGLVQAGSINLTSAGKIGGNSSNPLPLNSGTTASDTVSLTAQTSLFVEETAGDLQLVKATATTGDAYIEVAAGTLIDANTTAEVDERTRRQLLDGVWSDLQLTTGTGANTKVAEAQDAFACVIESEYNAYWNYRSTQPDPSVYDPTFQITLTAEEEAYRRTVLLEDDAAIAALENKRTAAYHALHPTYGDLSTYADYSWNLSTGATFNSLDLTILESGSVDTSTLLATDRLSEAVVTVGGSSSVDTSTLQPADLISDLKISLVGSDPTNVNLFDTDDQWTIVLNSTSVSYTATADDVSMLDVLSGLTDAIDALSDFSATLADDLTIEVTSTSPFTADTSDNKVAFTAVEIPFAPGDKWSIVVNGITVEYTAQASDQRLSDIASGLSGLIDGQATVTSTVDANGDVVITASQPFTATSADSKIGLTATEVPFAIGDTWEVEIDGTTFSTSATASQQTLAEIATALALQIDGDLNLTAAATDDAINVTGTAFEATTSDAKVTLSKPDNPLTVNIVKTGSNATITRTDGGSWIDDGFVQDMVLQIFSQTPESPSQNESDAETELPILSVTDSVITIGDASGFVDETGVDVIVQQRFAYTLSAADIRLVTSTIKIWTEDELLSLISAGLLKPITDTQAADEDVNIDAAGHVTIVAAGNIGTATGRAAIDLDNLSQDDRVVLAAAERTDVAFLKKTPVSATVNFGDTGSTGDTITRTDGGDWIADGLVVGEYIEVWGEVANATPGGTYYQIATVSTDTITLVVDDSLSNESGVTITVAPIVLDPVADANDVIGLTRWWWMIRFPTSQASRSPWHRLCWIRLLTQMTLSA